MVKKITTFFLLIVILTSLFITVFSSVAFAKRGTKKLCDYSYCGNTYTATSTKYYDGIKMGTIYKAPRYEAMPPDYNPVRSGYCYICRY